MPYDVRKLVFDLDRAVNLIIEFTSGRSLADYRNDIMLRSAVERQFEIIGEALNRMKRTDPTILARIDDFRRIIAFRNILIHGYDVVSDELVWDIITEKIPSLRAEIDAIKKDLNMT